MKLFTNRDADYLQYSDKDEIKGKNMSEWRPISTAPKDGTKIIAYLEAENHCDEVWKIQWLEEEEGQAGWYDNYGGDFSPIYWMPLPDPPKKKHCCTGENRDIQCYLEDGKLILAYETHSNSQQEVVCCPFCGACAND